MRIGSVSMEMIAVRMFNSNMEASSGILHTMATGFRINRAADDPSGLIASQYLSASLASLDAETRALSRADMAASTADGAMSEVSDLLVEAEGLAVAAANTGGTTAEEREAMQIELDSIMQTVDRLSHTSFNGRSMFNGEYSLSVGQDSVTLSRMSSNDLGLSGTSLTSGDPEAAADAIRAARERVTTSRAELGAFQKNAIEPRVRSMSIAAENTASAYSFIRDTDYAAASANYARQSILVGSSGRSLGLAMASNENVLNLLNG